MMVERKFKRLTDEKQQKGQKMRDTEDRKGTVVLKNYIL